jgi:hypothetical protein
MYKIFNIIFLGLKNLFHLGSELPHPFGLAVFRDKIYWTDWDTSSIHMADKQTGKNKTILRYESSYTINPFTLMPIYCIMKRN